MGVGLELELGLDAEGGTMVAPTVSLLITMSLVTPLLPPPPQDQSQTEARVSFPCQPLSLDRADAGTPS